LHLLVLILGHLEALSIAHSVQHQIEAQSRIEGAAFLPVARPAGVSRGEGPPILKWMQARLSHPWTKIQAPQAITVSTAELAAVRITPWSKGQTMIEAKGRLLLVASFS